MLSVIEEEGGSPLKLTCKITEITVAKIKIFGQDGWILTKFAKQKNDVLNDGNRQRGKIYTSQQIFCFE